MFFPLLTNAGDAVTGTAVQPQNKGSRPYMVVQAEYGASVTGNVIIEGRISPDYSYVTLHTFTASGSKELSWFPYVRARTTSIAGGTATVSAGLRD